MFAEAEWLGKVVEQNKQIGEAAKALKDFYSAERTALLSATAISRELRAVSEVLRGATAEFQALINGLYEDFALTQTPEFESFQSEFGWLAFMPAGFMMAFFKEHKAKGWEEAWQEVEGWFDQKDALDEVKGRIAQSSIAKARLPVLERGLEAHLQSDYVASISILLPQVEGLIWDVGVQLHLVDNSHPLSEFKLNGQGKVILDKKGKPVKWGMHDLVSAIWKYPPFEVRFKDKVYSGEFRHPILHGRDNTKFTKRKSVESILLLQCATERAIFLGL